MNRKVAAFSTRNVVGWHYFKYLDDPPESKALDNLGGALHREVYPLIDFFDARRAARR